MRPNRSGRASRLCRAARRHQHRRHPQVLANLHCGAAAIEQGADDKVRDALRCAVRSAAGVLNMVLVEEVSTTTAKGQTTVPKAVRQAIGASYDGRIAFRVEDGNVTVRA